MRFNPKSNIEGLFPWDFELELDGQVYKTRRPSLGMVLRLHKIGALSNEEGVRLFTEMFAGEAPDPSGWEMPVFTAAVAAYLAYFAEANAKNSPAIAESIGTAIAKEYGRRP